MSNVKNKSNDLSSLDRETLAGVSGGSVQSNLAAAARQAATVAARRRLQNDLNDARNGFIRGIGQATRGSQF